jgi:uncharacterized protein DUF6689
MDSKKRLLHAAVMVTLLGFALGSRSAPAAVTTTIDGRTSMSHITLPGANWAGYTADVYIEFDNPQKLTAACLNVTADVIDATEEADIEGRMPSGSNVAIDHAFAVRITISPLASCGFAFDNYYDIEIHAANLSYAPGGPYRLYKAPVGGAFRDITSSITAGSVRARGRHGAFSEFVIVSDQAPDYAADANLQYNALQARITASTIATTTKLALSSEVASSRSAFNSGNYAAAINYLTAFDGDVAAGAGSTVPNKWQAANPSLDNVAGEMAGLSGVIQFYLGRLNGAP